ncbi:dynein light chain Tctex-type protein 2B [Penaeus vannamei]|uniref:Putative tctex1 domain-containing protein 2-like n=1 Tax=Penaeus vannamei TaxID=6689 RepID=A0A423TT54_PENVA|nr:tctex1 domain-containing protein 2-like [Penaeus vannamei]XP_037774598.1 tctex1 domain-containing protein 2-like [Penaeus monodon]XP_037774605.1 tctex1 domain-containing protein 2-like [Penaeus monodon]XP_037774610.1 tctex1 domain-containing protein 2-like [Penaeus monodon]XP_042882324.1 dynein light chain Tctex-type protein 2B-like [Penaeus japonicus]XP_042882325.1 dynein light chain Tctex-type protein 2B-like [Penaeus japonicus]XP_042882327.1 dynein light chain Tctex-type protein 2B-like
MASTATDQNTTFQIRPDLKDKFRSTVVREIIHSTLVEQLTGFVYNAEAGEEMTKQIADLLRNKLLELNLPRYKFLVNVVIGEQRGEGVKVGARCLWDADADSYASDVFLAETFFCSAAVFAIYFY